MKLIGHDSKVTRNLDGMRVWRYTATLQDGERTLTVSLQHPWHRKVVRAMRRALKAYGVESPW